MKLTKLEKYWILYDHPKCTETNKGLNQRLEGAVDLAVMMMESFDESLRSGLRLNERFDRTFE